MFSSPGAVTLRAAHNLTITILPHAWRLYNGLPHPEAQDLPAPLVEASPQQIACAAAFAQARQLPRPVLVPEDIARVVVGWAPETRTWHLGLLLAAQTQDQPRLRWCGLVSWPAGSAHQHRDAAHTAGRALAQLIRRPLHVIPAPAQPVPDSGDTQPVQSTARLEPRPLPAPPIERPITTPVIPQRPAIAPQQPPIVFEEWILRATPQGYLWARRGRALAGTILRAGILAALVVLYIVLGVGTQTSGLAEVRPGWLPWLGLGVALVLTGLVAASLAQLLGTTDLLIDTRARTVTARGRFSGRRRWQVPFDQVAYVLLSQTPARQQGSARDGGAVPIQQDVWLHLYDGTHFRPLAALEGVTGTSARWDEIREAQKTPGRRRLRLDEYDTPAHHAAQVLANAIDVEAWLDIRA